MPDEELVMSFEPNTIEHLGIKMYSNLSSALAELVANSYDARASRVDIKIYTTNEDKKIVVQDDGNGMSFEEINKCFLRIGRNRRVEELPPRRGSRKPTGKKGLGKLALFGIGETIEIVTKKASAIEKTRFIIDWEALKATRGADYKPVFEKSSAVGEPKGTIITLRKLKRKTDFEIKDIAMSLSRLFNSLSNEFRVFISINDTESVEVTNDLKFADLDEQFSWDFPRISESWHDEIYNKKSFITGKIITTVKPLKSGRTGITLFANGRLVNLPEFFGHSESSNFFTYAIGWLNVDFVDDIEPDVISTDRQSLNWEDFSLIKLRAFLKNIVSRIHADWRKKRKKKIEEDSYEATGIDKENWLSTVPGDKAKFVNDAINLLADPDSSSNPVSIVTSMARQIMPEYASWHWRYLHPEVQRISRQYYINKDYYNAVFECIKQYVNAVQTKTDSTLTDKNLLENIFSLSSPKLSVTKKFKKPNGEEFEILTTKDIKEGHRMLVLGAWQAFRCQFSHEVVADLRDSGLFTEQDCLDALSLVSHLFYRLENSESP